MSYARLKQLAKKLDAVQAGSRIVVGPVVDALTGDTLLAGNPAGRAIRVGFLQRGLHVGEDGRIFTTAAGWAALDIDPAWEREFEASDDEAGESYRAGGGEKKSLVGEAEFSPSGVDVWLPDYARPLLADRSAHQFAALLGGRGGAKSTAIGIVLLLLARVEPLRVLCARQFQASIAASVKQLLDDWIGRLGLAGEFRSTETAISHRSTGAGFVFIGLDRNVASVKSHEGFDIAWVEEAHTLSRHSLDVLVPTIRRAGSALWFSFNPEFDDDPVDDFFRGEAGPPPLSLIVECDYRSNPFFFSTSLPAVLARDMTGPDRGRADHIWTGRYQVLAEAAVLPAVEIGDVDSDDWPEVVGLDFSGGGHDPHALIRARVSIERRTIHVVDEWYSHAALEDIPAAIDGLTRPGEEVLADGSRPDVIEHLNRSGLRVRAAPKGRGSVITGIMWLRGFRLVVSPRCPRFAEEARRYSWKVDRRTGRILADPIDRDNHGIDALRYATSDLMQFGDVAGGGVIRW